MDPGRCLRSLTDHRGLQVHHDAPLRLPRAGPPPPRTALRLSFHDPGPREALVVNLEQIRCVITADEVLLLNSLDDGCVLQYVVELQRRLRENGESWERESVSSQGWSQTLRGRGAITKSLTPT
ncbi:hypothetical protein Scep_023611 [Stephania cephalantha]|uniref:Uncharacterized protein n=1 Tax=Stephania cephalantha TaxID=152367 RepID=A0AAP0EW11_9MAGN